MFMSNPVKKALALCLCFLTLFPGCGLCQTLGPVQSYDELAELASQAASGDVLLVSGDIEAADGEPLGTQSSVRIRSSQDGRASICALTLQDADVGFDNLDLTGSLRVEGHSSVHLSGDVAVTGASGLPGILFSGNGSLLVDEGASVTGGTGSAGITVSHSGGDFYGEIGGTVCGGAGETGGAGMEVSPLGDAGVMMISGQISGGAGRSMGGHAVNLYDLSGNAFVTVSGTLSGGQGQVGGNGMEIVAARGNVFVGVDGEVTGGAGKDFGGNAMMLMNLEESSSVLLSGSLKGGDVTGVNTQPGTSLLIVGDNTSLHASVNGCLLDDGMRIAQAQTSVTPSPAVTPLPEITPSGILVFPTGEATPGEAQRSGAEDGFSSPASEPDAAPAQPSAEQSPSEALP